MRQTDRSNDKQRPRPPRTGVARALRANRQWTDDDWPEQVPPAAPYDSYPHVESGERKGPHRTVEGVQPDERNRYVGDDEREMRVGLVRHLQWILRRGSAATERSAVAPPAALQNPRLGDCSSGPIQTYLQRY